MKYVNIGVYTFFHLTKHYTEELFNHIWACRYLRKILDLDYEFRLRYILLDLDWKSYGQRFIITLIRYFPGFGFGNNWTTNLDYNYFIFTGFGLQILRLLFISLDLELKVLGLRFWIVAIRFYWIWTWKYLNCDCDLGLWLI